jgi:antitoxin YefM
MPTISITDARKNIFALADQSKEAASPILVVNSRGSNFVVISEDDWKDIQETLALAAIPGLGETIQKAKAEDYSKKKPYSENDKW